MDEEYLCTDGQCSGFSSFSTSTVISGQVVSELHILQLSGLEPTDTGMKVQ